MRKWWPHLGQTLAFLRNSSAALMVLQTGQAVYSSSGISGRWACVSPVSSSLMRGRRKRFLVSIAYLPLK